MTLFVYVFLLVLRPPSTLRTHNSLLHPRFKMASDRAKTEKICSQLHIRLSSVDVQQHLIFFFSGISGREGSVNSLNSQFESFYIFLKTLTFTSYKNLKSIVHKKRSETPMILVF